MALTPPPCRTLVPIDQRLMGGHPGKPAVFGTVLSGDPQESFLNLYDGGGGRFSCGVWQCTPGTVAMADWPYEEFCVLLAGRVVITPRNGAPQEHRQGDAFVIPRGFTGIWDVRETVRKYYAIEKPPGPGTVVRRLLRAPLSLGRRLFRRGEPALAQDGL
ncbi:cupin domain-containing protein [Azospirillum isscasi]|uniref:Cupin domain-containing protein n=1 Tax=Azospirillum isscasi TaxID=3053926 RepID=A0ABU0WPD0_9PROT|nr:cupin domain-containing protein [Azospirillum isscasi]MDQ2105697.1 cupin domain-containing protein [Azospirillum isscasi]